jgi:formylglycine-generating enzyme required for sulfatase activity
MALTITCPVCGDVMFDAPADVAGAGFPCASCGAALFLPENDRLLAPAGAQLTEVDEELNRKVATIWDHSDTDFEINIGGATADPPSDHEILVSLGDGSDSAWLVDLNKKADDLGKGNDDGSDTSSTDGSEAKRTAVNGQAPASEESAPEHPVESDPVSGSSGAADAGTEVLEWGDVTSNPSLGTSPSDTSSRLESPTPAGDPPRRSNKQRERELRTVSVYLSATEDLAAERVLIERIFTRVSMKYSEVLDLSTHVFDHGGFESEFDPDFVGPEAADIVFLLTGRSAGLRWPPTCGEDRRGDYRSGTEFELHASVLERSTPGRIVFLHHTQSLATPADAGVGGEQSAGHFADLLETWMTGTGAPAGESYVPVSTGIDVVREAETRLMAALDAIVAERGLTPRDRADDTNARWWNNGSPFRALAPYTRAEATVFEGRTRETLEVISFLRKQAVAGRPWVMLAGHAGCGKSSLARAGVSGLLTQPGVVPGVSVWRKCVFRPGDAAECLVDSLASALMDFEVLPELGAGGMNPAKLSQIMKKNPRGIARQLETALDTLAAAAKERRGRGDARLLLVIDGLEEAFAGDQFTAEDRTQFFLNLTGLVSSRAVWLIVTARSEFVDLLDRQPELAAIQPRRALFAVEPPASEEFERIVGISSEAAGLWFGKDPASGKWLDRQIVDEAQERPERLWELSYCLQGLYDRRTPRGKITQSALDELGGIAGCISSVAEGRLAALSPAAAASLPRLAKELVLDYEESGILLPRCVPARYFAKEQDLAPLIDALVQVGLVTRFKPAGGGTQLRLASIGVVSSWPRFAEAFETSRQLPSFDPALAAGESSAEIDVSGLATSESEEVPVEDGIVDGGSDDFKLPKAPRKGRSGAFKIAGAAVSVALLAGGWWWGMRPYLFPRNDGAGLAANTGESQPDGGNAGSRGPSAPASDRTATSNPEEKPAPKTAPVQAVAVAAPPQATNPAAPAVPSTTPGTAPAPVPAPAAAPAGVEVASASGTPNPPVTPPAPESPTSTGDKAEMASEGASKPDVPKPADVVASVPAVAAPPVPATPETTAEATTNLGKIGENDEFVNSLKMKLRRIPAGAFDMGSPAGESGRHDDEPRRRVTISRPIYVGIHEVTQAQYEELMGRNPSGFKGKTLPADNISWNDAVEFCRRLSEREQEKAAGAKYRLPTEAEWEYACRAGGSKAFSFGNAAGSREANFDGTQPYGTAKPGPDLATTVKVGSYAPNAFGLHDMHGNVAEWCSDWFVRSIDMTVMTDPTGPATGSRRVIRGGSWLSAGVDCRSAWRGSETPERFDSILGFRVVADAP